jgi:hypothetical protein
VSEILRGKRGVRRRKMTSLVGKREKGELALRLKDPGSRILEGWRLKLFVGVFGIIVVRRKESVSEKSRVVLAVL